jgi:hypothetical protein
MIKTDTLFILGAGSSKPFDYPTSDGLRNMIRKGEMRHKLVGALNTFNDDKRDFERIVDKFTSEFSKSSVNIDFFLEHRAEFMDIGKMAIATYLIQFEKDEKLRGSEDNWYMYLYGRLKSSFEDFDKNKISFITFNYDRSLEQFLFEAVRSTFNKPTNECAERVNKFPIVHLYGQLDFLPWQNPKGRSYSHTIDFIKRIRESVNNLELISDERDVSNSEEFQKAYGLIEKARNIYFLGFSFDETNLKRLNIKLMKGKRVIGTALGLERTKRNWTTAYFGEKRGSIINLEDMDSLSLVKEYLEFE